MGCKTIPLNCEQGTYGGWSTCSKKCYPFTKETETRQHGEAGYSFRHASKTKMVDADGNCGLADQSQCYEAWGGGTNCSTLSKINPHYSNGTCWWQILTRSL